MVRIINLIGILLFILKIFHNIFLLFIIIILFCFSFDPISEAERAWTAGDDEDHANDDAVVIVK